MYPFMKFCFKFLFLLLPDVHHGIENTASTMCKSVIINQGLLKCLLLYAVLYASTAKGRGILSQLMRPADSCVSKSRMTFLFPLNDWPYGPPITSLPTKRVNDVRMLDQPVRC